MFTLFIAAIILLIVGVATGIFIRSGKYKKYSTVVIAATVVVSLGGIAYSCVRTVPTGHTGIVTTFGNVENYNFEAGVHICAPWHTVVAMAKGTVHVANVGDLHINPRVQGRRLLFLTFLPLY